VIGSGASSPQLQLIFYQYLLIQFSDTTLVGWVEIEAQNFQTTVLKIISMRKIGNFLENMIVELDGWKFIFWRFKNESEKYKELMKKFQISKKA
jgi:hypothetical protein